MSTKIWKNKELNKLLTESWGFNMDLSKLTENSEELSEARQEDHLPCVKVAGKANSPEYEKCLEMGPEAYKDQKESKSNEDK